MRKKVVAPAVTSPAPSAAKLPQAQKAKPAPAPQVIYIQPSQPTQAGSGWSRPASAGNVQADSSERTRCTVPIGYVGRPLPGCSKIY